MTRYFLIVFMFCAFASIAQKKQELQVIAYYSRGPEQVDSIPAKKLTQVIFSFCHLKGNLLQVDDARDSLTIKKLVALKKINPSLKVILSLGGWGGCAPCSEVFSTEAGRKEFSQSVLKLNQYFGSDGLDLDWEYPAVEGYPGHRFVPEDKKNFTALIVELRKTLGKKYELSFAAGGFQKFLDEAVEWKEIMPLIDRVNLMTYDLINGYSTQTGHHTALYSRSEQKESTDNAVQYLVKLGVPRNKMVIGTAFYARVWENVPSENNGLYQPGKFKTSINYKQILKEYTKEKGFESYWDDASKAPYLYNAEQKLFATYDDLRSIRIKTQYAIDQKLNGLMFWEVSQDKTNTGLVNAINEVKDKAVK